MAGTITSLLAAMKLSPSQPAEDADQCHHARAQGSCPAHFVDGHFGAQRHDRGHRHHQDLNHDRHRQRAFRAVQLAQAWEEAEQHHQRDAGQEDERGQARRV